MQCKCGYEDNYDKEQNIGSGDKGRFYYSTFAKLERRKDRHTVETQTIYGCPSCGRVFINTTS